MQQKLKRHVARAHAGEPDVNAMMSSSNMEAKEISSSIRKKGILIENRKKMAEESPKYLAERNCDADKLLCTGCSGFYSVNTFSRHKLKCKCDDGLLPSGVETQYLAASGQKLNSSFEANILSRLRNDAIGQLAKTDATIRAIGERLYMGTKKKVDMEQETRRRVMSEMRLLARVFLAFNQQDGTSGAQDASAMFQRQHFDMLEKAVEEVTTKDDAQDGSDLKYGIKYRLYYILRNSAMILKGLYRRKMEDQAASDIDHFLEILKGESNVFFGDATYAITKARSEKLRVPERLPEEEDMVKLRCLMLKKLKALAERNFPAAQFPELRDALCARLTLFNARRGNEATRMTVQQCDDAISKRWIKENVLEDLDEFEKMLAKTSLITYIRGKCNKQVPVIIPSDCIEGLIALADPKRRQEAGVSHNKYLFASLHQSENHIEGWFCIGQMAKQANVADPSLLNATRQRHRISTKFAELELPHEERELFYSHMGHSGEMNRDTYQHPLAVKSLVQVGKQLDKFDRCKQSVLNIYSLASFFY
jgi:hypothetical protein